MEDIINLECFYKKCTNNKYNLTKNIGILI